MMDRLDRPFRKGTSHRTLQFEGRGRRAEECTCDMIPKSFVVASICEVAKLSTSSSQRLPQEGEIESVEVLTSGSSACAS